MKERANNGEREKLQGEGEENLQLKSREIFKDGEKFGQREGMQKWERKRDSGRGHE